VWDEANLVNERLSLAEVTRANLLLVAISANLGKEGHREFNKRIRMMTFEVVPYEDPKG